MEDKLKEKKIEVRCTGSDYLALSEMQPLQNNLKELTEDAAQRLKNSIIDHGIFFPFFVWKAPGGENKYIDGHQRDHILLILQKEGYELPEKYPVCFIQARDEKEAAQAILLQTSRYGKINDETLYDYINAFDLVNTWPDFSFKLDLPDIQLPEFNEDWITESLEENINEKEIDENIETTNECPQCGYKW